MNGAVIAAIIAAIIAYSLNKINIKRESKEYIKSIHYWINLSKKTIVYQRNYCIKSFESFKNRDRIDTKEFIYTPQLFHKIDQFDFVQLLRFIQVNCKMNTKKNNIQIVYDIIKVTEFLNALEDEMKRKHESYINEVGKIKEHWYEEIKEFHVMFGKCYVRILKKNHTQSNCCSKQGLEKLYQKIKFNDMLNINENRKIIEEILLLYSDCITGCCPKTPCSFLPDLIEIAMQANHLLSILHDFKQKEDDMADYFKNVVKELNNVCDIIDELSVMKDLKLRGITKVI